MDYRNLLKNYMFLIGELEGSWYMNELQGLLAAGGITHEEYQAIVTIGRELEEELREDDPEHVPPAYLD